MIWKVIGKMKAILLCRSNWGDCVGIKKRFLYL